MLCTKTGGKHVFSGSHGLPFDFSTFPRGAVRASGHSVSAYRNSDDILQIALMMTRIMTLITLTVLLPFLVLWSPSWAQKSKGKGRIQSWDGS